MNNFFNWLFAIYWIVMAIMCFTGTISLSPMGAGFACLVASVAFWQDIF